MSFEDVIRFAVVQRPKLKESIGFTLTEVEGVTPSQFALMYDLVSGTKQDIDDQSVMDIVPGLRLIHRSEMADEIVLFRGLYKDLDSYLPFLADYSSCYISLNLDDGCIYRVAPEYGTSKVANNIEAYWETVLACYNEEAFYLDEEGFLDFDFEKEGEIGERINKNCEYWCE